jgi:hypothetical protein
MHRCSLLFLPLLLLLPERGSGQEKKPDPKDQPRPLYAMPLGVTAGTTTKVLVRGLKLDTATAVRTAEWKVTVKLLKKEKTGVPNQADPNKLGDTQVELELTVPKDFAGEAVSVVLTTPGGTSAPHRILVDATPVVAEKEPNNGFRQAQPVQLGQTVQGKIDGAQDVDVFRFDGNKGQRVVLEILAARLGSPLDSVLTLYDADGRIVASNDDFDGGADSRLEVTLPRDGVYFVSVLDAHDQGGPTHVYRLQLRGK